MIVMMGDLVGSGPHFVSELYSSILLNDTENSSGFEPGTTISYNDGIIYD